jgi:hypothetical protein
MFSESTMAPTTPTPPTITIERTGTNLVIQWSAGNLFSTTNLAGPWTVVTNATSPYTNTLPSRQEFYKAGTPY